MRPVDPAEILDLTAYEKSRVEFMQRMIDYKKSRRVSVGDSLTFIFENRETVIFQIQELTRAERTVDPEQIAIECKVFNELVPGKDELSATLMIEITDPEMIRPELDRLVGIDEHVYLDIGDSSIRATFDEKQFEEDRISAVQYVRFPLGAELAARFRDPSQRIVLRVEHPVYREATEITGETRASLVADLDAE
jgi:hypothetical protein